MRVLAEKTKALADEHGKSFAKNSMGSLGLSVANVPGSETASYGMVSLVVLNSGLEGGGI